MPIKSLENPVFISVDGVGRPNASGTVGVYVAGTSFGTLATIYSDQVKTSELTNPVTLSGAGVKEIWFDVAVDIQEKTEAGVLIRDTLNIDPTVSSALNANFNLAPNGSFESSTGGIPDDWTLGEYSGSTIATTTSVVTDGIQALEFNPTGAGSGGGIATSSKFTVTEGSVCSANWSFFATNATTLNLFQIKWYDESDTLKSTSTLTMPASGSAPTSWTEYTDEVTAHAEATQGEIVLTGISSGGSNLSSKAYFDGIDIINLTNMVTLAGTQTLINKTLTNPIVTNPSVTGTVGGSATYTAPILATPSTTGFAKDSVTSGITADTGSSQGDGALTSGINEISTCATEGDAVTLPTATGGQKVTVINNGANACDVFPASGDNLGAGVDVAISLPAGQIITYTGYDATNWEASSSTSVSVSDFGSDVGYRELISTQTASSSATVDFDNLLDGTYKLYEVDFISVIPAVDSSGLYAAVQTGGTTWQTGLVYTNLTGVNAVAVIAGLIKNTTSAGGTSGRVRIPNPSSSTMNTHLHSSSVNLSSSTGFAVAADFAAMYQATTAVTGIRFVMSSGDITSGEFKLYGVK